MKKIFVKQTHTDFKVLFGIAYLICIVLFAVNSIRNQSIRFITIMVMVILLILCCCASKLLNSFGIYVKGDKIFYKKIRTYPIDINSVCAIKVIKSEFDGKYGRRTLRDIHGNVMYSMIFLSNVIESMYNYDYGDTMFIHEFKDYIIFYSILNEELIEYIKSNNSNIYVID